MRLPFDIRTLQRYEKGEQPCPVELVPEFVEAYGEMQLPYRVAQDNDAFRMIIPEGVQSIPLPQAACALLSTIMEIGQYQRDILAIVADGCIAGAETSKWDEVLEVVKRIVCAGLQVMEATAGAENK